MFTKKENEKKDDEEEDEEENSSSSTSSLTSTSSPSLNQQHVINTDIISADEIEIDTMAGMEGELEKNMLKRENAHSSLPYSINNLLLEKEPSDLDKSMAGSVFCNIGCGQHLSSFSSSQAIAEKLTILQEENTFSFYQSSDGKKRGSKIKPFNDWRLERDRCGRFTKENSYTSRRKELFEKLKSGEVLKCNNCEQVFHSLKGFIDHESKLPCIKRVSTSGKKRGRPRKVVVNSETQQHHAGDVILLGSSKMRASNAGIFNAPKNPCLNEFPNSFYTPTPFQQQNFFYVPTNTQQYQQYFCNHHHPNAFAPTPSFLHYHPHMKRNDMSIFKSFII